LRKKIELTDDRDQAIENSAAAGVGH